MTTKGDSSRQDKLAREAAGWVARLQSSDATDRDRHAFEEWLSKDPAHRAAYDEFKGLWAALEHVPIPTDRLRKLRLSRRAAIANIAGLCLVAALSVSLYRMGLVDRFRADHYTSVGEVRSVELEDGTKVTLNTDTAIALHFTDIERRIELLRGEAFFDVRPDPARRFVVTDETMRATAIGTRYGVRAPSSGFAGDVQVEEGIVDVRHAQEQATLRAGDVATVTDDGTLAIGKTDVASAVSWKDGQLVFSNQPLGAVLATLERYRHGRIIILGDEVARLHVSGIFDVGDTDEALRIISGSLPVRVTYLTRMMIVVRAR